MRTSFFAGVLAFAASVTAQLNSKYNTESAPFNLILISKDETINGTLLTACHEGAAVKGLCLGPKASDLVPTVTYSTYNFNYPGTSKVDPKIGQVGLLTYVIRAANMIVPSLMNISPLQKPANSNLAVPLFTPDMTDALQVVFDKNDKLAVPGNIDDKTASAIGAKSPQLYCRWYACTISMSTYVYQQLAWTINDQSPSNPTCVKVDVVRVFV
jgi:hypothetical protein